MAQTYLARIPLLISFPTIILSSCLLVPTYQDILEQYTKHQNGQADSTVIDNNNDIPYILFIDSLIRLIFLPLFISTSFTLVGCTFNIINKKWNAIIPILSTSIIVAQLNYVFNPIQATLLSILTIKQLIQLENGEIFNDNISLFIKSYGPLIILSLIINCTSNNTILSNYLSKKGPWVYWLSTSTIYILFTVSLRFIYPLFKFKLLKNDYTENEQQQQQQDSEKKSVIQILLPVVIVSIVCVYLLTLFHSGSKLQILMIFVFLGCLTIFFLSFKDILIDIDENNMNEKTNSQNKSLEFPNFIILSMGIMSIALQYLSFNKIASSLKTDILTIVLVITTEYTSRITNDSKLHHVHTTNRKTTHSHSHSHTHEENIFKQIVLNKDTRSIFSFLLLNTTFMFVQLLYSFRSKSLGLLSDSLHMALDCTSLFLGLLASVLSKRKVSDKFPFHLKYLETLAGFTNGILLIGIVCGIYVESVGRIFNPMHLKETNELLVVSILGLLVNLVGLVAFDHTGSGHDHGDSANSDNMRGIFLHILADTLGSVGVIISTILIKLTDLHIFDPIASIMIATLILLSALPLLKSTASNLLLKLDDKKHNVVKNALNQIAMTPGITGYTTPRFWPNEPNSSGHSHSHMDSNSNSEHYNENTHGHEHEHEHKHQHDNEYKSKKPINCTLVGYIHIQYSEGENSTIIKKRVEKILEDVGIKAWIQVEPRNSNCWCRSSSMSSIINRNVATPNNNGHGVSH